jgi:hypothetical protein
MDEIYSAWLDGLITNREAAEQIACTGLTEDEAKRTVTEWVEWMLEREETAYEKHVADCREALKTEFGR